MSKYDALWHYVASQSEECIILSFSHIEQITGFPIDHSFLTFKKELNHYGWKVGKISLKGQTVRFEKSPVA